MWSLLAILAASTIAQNCAPFTPILPTPCALVDARIGLTRDSHHDYCAARPVDEDLPWQPERPDASDQQVGPVSARPKSSSHRHARISTDLVLKGSETTS